MTPPATRRRPDAAGGRDLRVCFVGDSYVAGLGDSSALGWVGRVTADAIEAGLPLTSYNLGIRRDTSVLISRRIAHETQPRLQAATDPRVVLSFGVNDTDIEAGAQRATTQETLDAFTAIHAVSPPARLMLIGPPAVHDDAHDQRLSLLTTELEGAARSAAVPFVDTFTATLESALWREQIRAGDSFHPDAAGYALLTATIAPSLLAWLTLDPGHRQGAGRC